MFLRICHSLFFLTVVCVFLNPVAAEDGNEPAGAGTEHDNQKAVVNLFSVAMAARAAGSFRTWTDVPSLILDLEAGITLDLQGTPVVFKIMPMTEAEKRLASQLLEISRADHGLPVWKKPQ